MRLMGIVAAWMFAVNVGLAAGGPYTWYADVNRAPGVENGASPATAYTRIGQALAALSATNAIEGASGGHTIIVAAGTYPETVVLTGAHSGAVGKPVTIRTDKRALIRGARYCFQITGVKHVAIRGFRMDNSSGQNAVHMQSSEDVTIGSCAIRAGTARADGLRMNGCTDVLIDHCTIYNELAGVFVYGASTVRLENSIVVGCAFGVGERARGVASVNCCFYGNGVNFYDNGFGPRNTQTALNEAKGWAQNIVANPNLCGTHAGDFFLFYENSACFKAASDGTHIGAYQEGEITTRAFSSRTYWVDGEQGDDSAGDGSSAAPWKSISKAATAAIAGDTVVVRSGYYEERDASAGIRVTNAGGYDAVARADRPITFRADGAVTVVCGWAGFNLDHTSGIVMDGFVLRGNAQHTSRYGVVMGGSYACALKNLEVHELGFAKGAGLDFGQDITVTDCTVQNNAGEGMRLGRGASAILADVNVCSNASGIYIGPGSVLSAEGCRIAGNREYGVSLYDAYVDVLPQVRFADSVMTQNGDSPDVNADEVVFAYRDAGTDLEGKPGVLLDMTGMVRLPTVHSGDRTNLMVYTDSDGECRPVKTVNDWEKRRAEILANFQVVAGPLPDDSRKVPLDIQVVEETALPKFIRKKITFAVEKGDRVPAHLFIPNGLTGKAPAMLCLHQTNPYGKDEAAGLKGNPTMFFAPELAERGFVTLAPDYINYNDYRYDPYTHGYASGTMKGIWNHMRAVDLLQSLPEVDKDAIGVCGHSLGGHNSIFLGVFDQRVRFVGSSAGFSAFPFYKKGDVNAWASAWLMPRIRSVYGARAENIPFDFTELVAALAPRTFFVNSAQHDPRFTVAGVQACIDAAMPVYRLFGTEERVVVVHPEGTHYSFPPEFREKMYDLARQVLAPGN